MNNASTELGARHHRLLHVSLRRADAKYYELK